MLQESKLPWIFLFILLFFRFVFVDGKVANIRECNPDDNSIVGELGEIINCEENGHQNNNATKQSLLHSLAKMVVKNFGAVGLTIPPSIKEIYNTESTIESFSENSDSHILKSGHNYIQRKSSDLKTRHTKVEEKKKPALDKIISSNVLIDNGSFVTSDTDSDIDIEFEIRPTVINAETETARK